MHIVTCFHIFAGTHRQTISSAWHLIYPDVEVDEDNEEAFGERRTVGRMGGTPDSSLSSASSSPPNPRSLRFESKLASQVAVDRSAETR